MAAAEVVGGQPGGGANSGWRELKSKRSSISGTEAGSNTHTPLVEQQRQRKREMKVALLLCLWVNK